MGLMDGLFGRKSDPRPPSPPVASFPVGIPAAEQRRAACWFSGEAPEEMALGQASLRALAQARPQPVDPPLGNDDPLTWLQEALTRLEALSERVEALRPGRLANALPWRYLIFIRVLCDALETAHQAALHRHSLMRCPLTRIADPHRPAGAWRAGSPRIQDAYSGLGTLLAGVWLPEEGQKWIFSAAALGIDWMDSAAFWAQVNASETTPAPSLPTAAPVSTTAAPAAAAAEPRASALMNAGPRRPRAASPQGVARASTTAAPAQPPSRPEAEAPGVKTPPLKDDDPFQTCAVPSHPTELSQAVRQVLQDLIRHPLFNRQPGPGWRTEEAYWVTARLFAEQLMEQPWVKAQQFSERRVIYHRMGRQGLLLPHGSNAVWSIFVTDPGEAQARLVPALKLPACLLEKPRVLPYQWRLQLENPWVLEEEFLAKVPGVGAAVKSVPLYAHDDAGPRDR